MLALVNNANATATVACDAACFTALLDGATPAAKYTVKDLVSDVGPVSSSRSSQSGLIWWALVRQWSKAVEEVVYPAYYSAPVPTPRNLSVIQILQFTVLPPLLDPLMISIFPGVGAADGWLADLQGDAQRLVRPLRR